MENENSKHIAQLYNVFYLPMHRDASETQPTKRWVLSPIFLDQFPFTPRSYREGEKKRETERPFRFPVNKQRIKTGRRMEIQKRKNTLGKCEQPS